MNNNLYRTVVVLAAAYLALVAVVVLWPTPVDRSAAGMLHETLAWLQRHGMPSYINYQFVEFTANIAMFVPVGLIISAFLRNARVGVVLGVLASCLIELFQALTLPERYATGLDVLANTVGASLGAMAYFLLAPRLERILPPPAVVDTAFVPSPELVDSRSKWPN